MRVSDAKYKSLRVQWLIHLGAIAALVISLVLWPQPARADWRSLTGVLPAYVGRVDFKISPDSRTVVFIADIDTDDQNELYAVPITGTTPIKLNPPLVEGGYVNQFIFMPDGQSVIYQAEQEVDNRFELFRVPVTGGPAVKLNGPLVAGGNVFAFKIDTGNGRVVYIADQETNEIFEVWSASLDGGGVGNVKLNGTLVTGGNVASFQIDPLSDRVVYNADQDTNGKYELYSVPIAGGSPLKLNPPLDAGNSSGLFSFYAVNPVIPVVVFVAPESVAQGRRLYMIPTAGGELTQLNFNFLPDEYLVNFRISPTGDRVVFSVGKRLGNQYPSKGKLYSALIGGGGAADVSEAADPMFGVDRFEIMPDGNHIIYTFQEDADTTARLESATMLGERAPLYTPSEQEGGVLFNFSPDSDWVIFRQQLGIGQDRLFTIPPTGGNSTNFGNVSYKQVFPDNSRITYSKIVGIDNQNELFSQQIFGGGERNLSGMNGEGYIVNVDISPDSKWVVFVVQIPDQSGEQFQYQLRVSDGTTAQANTPTPTSTPTPTVTPTPMPTLTPTVTPTPSVTPTGTISPTPDPSATPPAGTTPGAFDSHLPSLFGREPED